MIDWHKQFQKCISSFIPLAYVNKIAYVIKILRSVHWLMREFRHDCRYVCALCAGVA